MSPNIIYMLNYPQTVTKEAQLYVNIISALAQFYSQLRKSEEFAFSEYTQHSLQFSVSDENDYSVTRVIEMLSDNWDIVKDNVNKRLVITPKTNV